MTDTAWGASRRTTGPDTGGADLGSMANVGGTIPGLKATSALVATALPVGITHYLQGRKAGKDYNDAPVDKTVGTEGGRTMKDAGEIDPYPAL